MAKCYVCEHEITSRNKSDEHILLNSIGGRLHSPDLICSKCRPQFDEIDSCLSQQLNPIANMLNIKRDRGTPQPIDAEIVDTGEKIHLSLGGKPVIVKPKIEVTKDVISVTARDRKQGQEVLNGLRRTYPEIAELDIEAIVKQAEKKSSYLNSYVNFTILIGGDKAFRSICKTAINFYIFSGGNCAYITHLIPYIRDGNKGNYVWHYYPDDNNTPDNLKDRRILHTIFIKGDVKQKLLYSVVEFFSTFKFIVLLSDRYIGEEVNYSYSFDVMKKVKLEINIYNEIPKMQILKILQDEVTTLNQKGINELFQLIMEKQNADEMNRLMEKAISNSFEKYPESTILTEDIIRDVIEEIMETIAPFIAHHFQIRENNY